MVAFDVWLRLAGGIVLLLGNGFFVTTEFALTRVRQFPSEEFTGHRGLERAWDMTERLEIFLSGCQVGITVCSVGLGVVAEPAVAAAIAPLIGLFGLGAGAGHSAISVGIALAVINLLHVVVGEQAPTYLGVERTKYVAKYGAPVLYWWTKVMGPVIYVSDWAAKALLSLFGVSIDRSWAEEEAEGEEPTSRGELRRRMGESLGALGLTSERREEVINALEIGRVEVRDVMVDVDEAATLSTEDTLEENLEVLSEQPHGRYPLVGEDVDEFEGIVYTPALLRHLDELEAGETDLTDVAAPPMTVTASTSVSDAIDQFQAQGQELALVLDGGETVGLITATDAFECITGELEDPLDRADDE